MKLQKRLLAGVLALALVLCSPCLAATVPANAAPPQAQNQASEIPAEAGAALGEAPSGYTLSLAAGGESIIAEDAPSSAAVPAEESCCALHFVLMVAALGVTLLYVHNQKQSQAEEFKLRCNLLFD